MASNEITLIVKHLVRNKVKINQILLKERKMSLLLQKLSLLIRN